RFQEQQAAAIAREMEQLQRQLDQSSVDLRRIDQEVDDLRGKASELPVLQERLKGFVEVAGPDAARINAAHAAKSRRAREEKLPELLITGLQKVARDIRSSHVAFQSSVEAQLDNEVRQGPNRELFDAVATDVATFTQRLAAAVQSIIDAADDAETRIRAHSATLAERHAVQEADYRTIVAAS